MSGNMQTASDLRRRIIETALHHGASVAGMAGKDALQASPSHRTYRRMGIYSGIGTVGGTGVLPHDQWFSWPDSARSALVIDWIEAPNLPARDGAYDRTRCNERMEKDVAQSRTSESGAPMPIHYCRQCEFVCPIGQKSVE